jgi:hypothetical protein
MSNKTLSYAEYQEKIKSITSPEEAVAFAQEMLAPVLFRTQNESEAGGNFGDTEQAEEEILQADVPSSPKPRASILRRCRGSTLSRRRPRRWS